MTNETGAYRFPTIRPGAYPWPNHGNAWRPRHIHFSLFGASFRTRLVTQMHFAGDSLLAPSLPLRLIDRGAIREAVGEARRGPPRRSEARAQALTSPLAVLL